MTTETKVVIPTGTLKHVNIADIDWDKRYREELGDIENLAESIRDKGVIQPITVSPTKPDGTAMAEGKLWLLAGERRLTAAAVAGLVKIPALIRKIEGDIDAREIELMENVFRKNFTWSEECALIQEIDKLYKKNNMDWSGRKTAQLLNKGIASVSRALQLARALDAMPELADSKTADDALKVVKKLEEQEIVKILRARQTSGGHALARGIQEMLKVADANYRIEDTFEGLKALHDNGSIDFIECDPPYGINLTEQKRGSELATSSVKSYNEIPHEDYQEFLLTLCSELFRVAATDSWLIFWFGPSWHTEVLAALRLGGWLVDEIPAIWAKEQGQTMQPEFYLGRAYEPFFVCRKGQPVMMKRGRLNVFNFPGVPAQRKTHPTERPILLIEELLEIFCPPTGIVLVPFLGSGATIRAAYNRGHRVFGWDINPEYKDKFMLAVEDDALHLNGEEDDVEEEELEQLTDSEMLEALQRHKAENE